MNKKGVNTRLVLWVFYILISLIIAYFIYNYIDDVSSGRVITKRYLVNDIGLSFDLISSANHNLNIRYTFQDDYSLLLDEGRIKIDSEKGYNYALDKNFITYFGEFSVKNNDTLIINKKENLIKINLENEQKR